MRFAQQMGIKVVHVVAELSADVATPRVHFRVAALVQEVERLVGKDDAAVNALVQGGERDSATTVQRVRRRRFRGRLTVRGGDHFSIAGLEWERRD